MGAIYVITNMQNGKKYVGQTAKKDPRERWQQHIKDLKKNKHGNRHLQNVFNKYGNIFSFEIVCEKSNIDELNEAECQYIEKWDTRNREYGYNIREGGRNFKTANITKERMSLANKKRNSLFGYSGAGYVNKRSNPWARVWQSTIRVNMRKQSLGYFEDPISANIVYELVWKEIYGKS